MLSHMKKTLISTWKIIFKSLIFFRWLLYLMKNNVQRVGIWPEYVPFKQHPFPGESENRYRGAGGLNSHADTVFKFPDNLFLTASGSGLLPHPPVVIFSHLLYFTEILYFFCCLCLLSSALHSEIV